MIRVSDRCYEQMQRRTNFEPVATVTLANGTVLNLTQADFTLGGNTIVDGAAANAVPLGVAVCKMVNLSLMNEDDRFSNYDFYGARITLNSRFPIHWTSASDTWETIYIGKFTVVTPKTPGSTITMTAADDMYKADRPYTSGLTYPATLRLIINDICATMSVTPPGTFPNESFRVEKKPVDVSMRQVIGGVAGLAGGNAYMDRYGAMQIRRYDQSSISSVLSGLNSLTGMPACHVLRQWMRNPTVDTDDIVITGVKIEMDDDQSVLYGNQGYVLVIDNPLVSGQEEDAARLIGNAVNGLRFRQFIGSYIGYPIADFMDPAIVIDRKGNAYGTFLTDITYTFCGGTEFKNSAEPLIRNQNHQYSSGTRTLQKIRELVNRRVSAYDIGVQNLTQIMTLGLGLYPFKEEKDDGSFTYTFGNHPTLEDSDVRWMFTAGGLAISEDYGVTWDTGLMANGTMIVKILTAIGIQADWITTGKLLAQDGQGNTIFMVDFDESDSARVEIHADAFTLSGQTIQQIAASEASGAFQNLTQQQIFNILTNNSQNNGIHLVNGVLYLDFTYAEGGTLKLGGENNGRGVLEVYASLPVNNVPSGAERECLARKISQTGEMIYNIPGSGTFFPNALSAPNNTSTTYAYYRNLYKDSDNKYHVDSYTDILATQIDPAFEIESYENSNTKYYGYRMTTRALDIRLRERYAMLSYYDSSVSAYRVIGYYSSDGIHIMDYSTFTRGVEMIVPYGKGINKDGEEYDFACRSIFASDTIKCDYLYADVVYADSLHLTTSPDSYGQITDQTKLLAYSSTTQAIKIATRASSKRYKIVGRQVTAEDVASAYDINVYMARYKPGFLEKGDRRENVEYPMFVAEQMYEHIPNAVDLNEKGECEAWNEVVLIPIMFQMIKDQKCILDAQQKVIDKQQQQLDEQQKRIDSLEERLRRLEEVR